MSPERREGQPRKNIDLLMPVPDIGLPHYANDLDFYLQKEGTILFKNDKLVVTNIVWDQDESAKEIYGSIYVHNKKNGLPNYSADYTRVEDDVYLEGYHSWEYKTVKNPFGYYPIIEAHEERIFPPYGETGKGSRYTLKTMMDLHEPSMVVIGIGHEDYDKKKHEFKPEYMKNAKAIYEQVSQLRGNIQIMPFDV